MNYDNELADVATVDGPFTGGKLAKVHEIVGYPAWVYTRLQVVSMNAAYKVRYTIQVRKQGRMITIEDENYPRAIFLLVDWIEQGKSKK